MNKERLKDLIKEYVETAQYMKLLENDDDELYTKYTKKLEKILTELTEIRKQLEKY